MIKNNLRRQVSRILKCGIPPKGWKKTFKHLEKDGRLDHKHLIEIIILLLEREEEREEAKEKSSSL